MPSDKPAPGHLRDPDVHKTSFLRSAFLLALAPIVIAVGCSTTAPLTTGSLRITIAGPPGGQASLIVSGPSGFLLAVDTTTTLTSLAPGAYTILAKNVVVSNATYGVTPASSIVTVVASNSPATATVTYALVSGGLAVTVTGLPNGLAASISITGPGGFAQTITGSQTLSNLLAGAYTIQAPNVVGTNATYGVTPASTTVNVVASSSPTAASVSYAVVSGGLAITVTGLPNGLAASIAVTGPGAFSQTLTGSGTLSNIPAGSYTLTPNPVSQAAGGATYADTLPPVVVAVPASLTPVAVGVPYMLLTGRIAVTVSAPGGVSPSVLVTGPAGYSRPITAAGLTTLTGLALGSYTVVATSVTLGTNAYAPAPDTQTQTLSIAQRSWAASIAYAVWSIRPIAFATNSGIKAINADGSGLVSLTSATDFTPVWSPNGTRLAFVSTRDSNKEIYIMNANGSGQTNLTKNPGDDNTPVWSPDGTKIAFVSGRDGNSEIYVMNADGSGQVNLTNNLGDDSYPSWSPDGKKIAFQSTRDGNGEIYVMNADGSHQVNLTNDPSLDAAPAWSPDGTRIAFVSQRGSGSSRVYVMQTDGRGVTELYPALAAPPPAFNGSGGLVWSPRGNMIAFLVTQLFYKCETCLEYSTSLYVMGGDGSNIRRLSAGGLAGGRNNGVSSMPSWAPDETAVAYTRYIIPDGYPGGGLHAVHTDGTGDIWLDQSNDRSPAWRP